jgi:hypothetical protein
LREGRDPRLSEAGSIGLNILPSVTSAVEQAANGNGEITLQATAGEMQALANNNKEPLRTRVQPYKDAGAKLGFDVTVGVLGTGKISIRVRKMPDFSREGLRANGRLILQRVADRIFEIAATGRKSHKDFLFSFYQTTHTLTTPLPPNHPARQSFPARLQESIQRKPGKYLYVEPNFHFDTSVHGGGPEAPTPRKVYITPPVEKIPEFLDAMLSLAIERGIRISGKIHFEAINRDGNKNIISVDQNLMPLYFESDAHFQRFLEILPEIEKRSGTTLYTFSAEDAPQYGHAYGGKVRFGYDKPGRDSYDIWSAQVFGAGIRRAMEGGASRKDIYAAMFEKMKKLRPELDDLNDFLALLLP